ncbi:MAG: DNA methyltransferase [Gammaproteobacteria bacterium]
MASLLKEFKGKIDLIYIDPPFDVGADFTMNVPVGDGKETLAKDQSTLEMVAYRDTWGKGTDSYVQMMYERLTLIEELLSERGSLYVHCDYRVNSHLRLMLGEIFGSKSIHNEIVWQRTNAHNEAGQYGRIHDTIFFVTKADRYTWHPDPVGFSQEQLKRYKRDENGRLYTSQDLTAERKASDSGRFEWAWNHADCWQRMGLHTGAAGEVVGRRSNCH